MFIEPTLEEKNKLLDNFLEYKINNYSKLRNYAYFSKDIIKNVSGLSGFISRGVLKEKSILKKVVQSGKSSDKFTQEIFWRVYWQGWLECHSNIWNNYKNDLKEIESFGLKNILNYQSAIDGNTNIEPFNEWVELLKNTGYLHNHVRMWFASIWIHYLEIPWQLGCNFFYENLLDGDVASNLLSWRWVAGLQTFGKKYIATEENINKYTNNRYLGLKLPKVRNVVLKNEDRILNSISASRLKESYKNSVFIIMNNNLTLDLFKKVKSEVKALVLLKFNLKPLEKSQNVIKFQEGIYKEFVQKEINEKYKYYEFQLPDENHKFISFLKNNKIKNLLLDYYRIGYEKDIFDDLISKIKDKTCVQNILDSFYHHSWEHCKKGFFKFREKIPMLLKNLN